MRRKKHVGKGDVFYGMFIQFSVSLFSIFTVWLKRAKKLAEIRIHVIALAASVCVGCSLATFICFPRVFARCWEPWEVDMCLLCDH